MPVTFFCSSIYLKIILRSIIDRSMQPIKITAEPQTEPAKCKFILENPIVEKGSYPFHDAKEAEGSGVSKLFAIHGVKEVFVSANTFLVTKETAKPWQDIGKEVGAVIREILASAEPLISEAMKAKLPTEEDIRKNVERVLLEEINPAVASHGGVVELLDVKNNDVFVRMGGGCQGCSMSYATLKQGVETAFRKAIPYLGAVYDTTDHAAGMNPYYSG